VVAAVAAAIGIGAAAVFPLLHRSFRLLRHPVLYVTLGGALLGVLGIIGGPITLFKGLEQTAAITAHRDDYSVAELAVIVAVKVVALLIAAAAGFRGGRVFPAVFTGTAIGVLANAVIPGIPVSLAIAAGVLGMVLAVARDGWIALFIAVAVTGSVTVLAVLCIAVLPTWLLVSRAPEMLIHAPPEESSAPLRPEASGSGDLGLRS
jgi:H+/Cl- antiporter ClcA